MRKTVAVKFIAGLANQPNWLIGIESLLLTLVIGFLDYMTSWEVSLFVFYGIPIFFVSWCIGRSFGIAFSVLAAAVWFAANLPTHPYLTQEGYLWAGVNRLFYFVFVAVGGTAMRKLRDENVARVEALTLARKLEHEVIRAGEREQIRIGQDLHDGLCQNLAAIDCATECLREELLASRSEQVSTVTQIQKFLKETIVEARNLARGIFPVQVESEGLASALNELTIKTNFRREVTMSFDTSGDVELEEPAVAVHLYRIAQEAVGNALAHSGATHIDVCLHREDSALRMSIRDDGRGFLPDTGQPEGIGLRTMRSRAQLIGAELTIESGQGRGTAIECVCPLADMAARTLEPVRS
jgi:signal transduction histidine kinase